MTVDALEPGIAIPADVLRNIRRIEIRTRRLVNDILLGQYHAVFRGRGIEFSEVREYQPGDDVRSIDWNVTARMSVPYVKQYREERELTVVLAADVSASSSFGTAGRNKSAVAAEAGALLALSAARNNDRVGMLTFTDSVERFLPPRKGVQHVLRVVRELLYPRPLGVGTDIGGALELLTRVLKRRSLVLLFSDLLGQGFETNLSRLARKHDLVVLSLSDPREEELPAMGLAELQDIETGERLLLDSSDPLVRRRYRDAALAGAESRSRLLRSMGIDEIALRTDRPVVGPLLTFFRARARRN